jgi:ankyrin repeat protein
MRKSATAKEISETVDFLLSKGANVNHQAGNKQTALHVLAEVSAAKGVADVAKLMLDRGCEVNAQDETGCTALDAAYQNKLGAEMIKFLKD